VPNDEDAARWLRSRRKTLLALGLVAARVVGIEDRIERVYLWQFERLMAVVKGAFVVWASLLATLGTVLFERDLQANWWRVLVLLFGLFGAGAIGIVTTCVSVGSTGTMSITC
jgi:hypothetical protein